MNGKHWNQLWRAWSLSFIQFCLLETRTIGLPYKMFNVYFSLCALFAWFINVSSKIEVNAKLTLSVSKSTSDLLHYLCVNSKFSNIYNIWKEKIDMKLLAQMKLITFKLFFVRIQCIMTARHVRDSTHRIILFNLNWRWIISFYFIFSNNFWLSRGY